MLLWVGCVLMTACNSNTVNFSYSPLKPKAGETIQFTNLSTKGEEWEWAFGDASTSTAKNPTKIYKQAGTYTVILKVDDKSNWKVSKSITIYDTIPGFGCSIDDVETAGIPIFEDVTFTALVYNPYNYPEYYEWSVSGDVSYTQLSAKNTEKSFKLYFSQVSQSPVTIRLKTRVNDDEREVVHTYTVTDVKTNSVLMMTKDSTYWSQRVFGSRAESVKDLTDSDLKNQVKQVQDTVQFYNGKTFTLNELQSIVPNMKGFVIAARKVYFRTTDGLYVVNIDGSCLVPIWQGTVLTQCADVVNNRLYWSLKDSVLYMPLIGSENNKFTTEPSLLNNKEDIIKLLIDPTKR